MLLQLEKAYIEFCNASKIVNSKIPNSKSNLTNILNGNHPNLTITGIFFLLQLYNNSQVVNFSNTSNDIMPSFKKLCPRNVPDTSENPWILEIQVFFIITNNDNIMSIFPIILVVSSRIGPCLKQYNNRLIVLNVILKVS